MKKTILFLCVIYLSVSSYAVNYTSQGLITGLFTGQGNVVGVFHDAPKYNPAGCERGGDLDGYLIDYNSTADWSKVHSMLITAYTTNTPIKIGVDPSKCFAGYAVISRVAFVKGY